MGQGFSVRLLAAVIPASILWVLIDAFPSHTAHLDVIVALVVFVVGLVAPPFLPGAPVDRAGRLLREAPIEEVVPLLAGIGLGLTIGALTAIPLSQLPYPAGTWLPVIGLVVITVFTAQVLFNRRADVSRLLSARVGTTALT
ncbi:MAG: hypothetical protein ACRDG4_18475, partial [Chloroflexota bacterium]